MKNNSLTGKCLCGQINYVVEAEPLTLYGCHCTDCQTVSGASFTLILQVKADCIRVVGDESTHCQERMRSDGRIKNIMRCPKCFTALWGFYNDKSKPMSLYSGTLNRSSELTPVGHIWTSSAQPWIAIPHNTLSFAKQPPDMEIFRNAWLERRLPTLS